MRYLTLSELIYINGTVLNKPEIASGKQQIRDLPLLDSAAARPALVLFGEPQFPTIVDKAASLLHSLAYHHLFTDGNKRTALRAVNVFLNTNGYRLTWDDATEYNLILEIAQGKHDVTQIAEQLAQYITVA
jgi:death-on-curing protein